MQGWGFRYVSNLVWAKRRKDGGPDGRGVGFYFRNVTELILFGVRGSMRTLDPGRRQVNMIETRKREHSRKPEEAYDLIEACSPGPVPRDVRPLRPSRVVELGCRVGRGGRSPRTPVPRLQVVQARTVSGTVRHRDPDQRGVP